MYGCGKASSQRYYEELRDLFCARMVPRLVFPRPPEELRQMASQGTLEQFPDLLAILDATNWQQQKPENFLLNRLSYSAYKHFVAFQALLGEYGSYRCVCTLLQAFFSGIDESTCAVAL